MFTQNMKTESKKVTKKLINEVQKKNKAIEKNDGVHFRAEKNGMCTGKKTYEKENIHKIYRITKCKNSQDFFFFSFHSKVNVVEYFISFGIEDNIFGPTKVREHLSST